MKELITSSLAEAVPPVPMKAILVGAIDWGCGPNNRVGCSTTSRPEGGVAEHALAERLAPIRSPISSAIETRPPPL